MKKLKILIVTSLALLLCFMCIVNTTFSWFTRPKELSGNALMFTNRDYDISSKEDSYFAINTYESTDGKTYGDSPVTAFPNSSELQPGARKYYRTDIINSGSHDQTLSLYLTNMQLNSTTGNFFLGVNEPTRTYKQYGGVQSSSGAYNKVQTNTMRVYFKPNGIWTENEFNICTNGSVYTPLNYLSGSGASRIFYIDIPTTTSKIFFAIKDYNQDYQRTAEYTLSSLSPKLTATNCLVLTLNSGVTGYNNINSSFSSVNGANFASYYSSISLGTGTTVSAALTNGTDFDGNKIEYYSSNTSIFTVDSNTGNITGRGVGTAYLYTKVTGAYNDVKEVVTTVTVTASSSSSNTFTDIPIVTNVYVPKGEGTETGQTIQSVYWYIKNDATSGDLKYTISDLYLTL